MQNRNTDLSTDITMRTINLGVLALIVVVTLVIGVQLARAEIGAQMEVGSEGSDVSEYQTYLSKNPHIYPSGLVTGYFGDLTKSGTEMFQTNQGIVSEGTPETTGYGRVGPLTMARLNSLMGGTYINYGNSSGDMNAPRIYPGAVSVDSDSATISWSTSESAIGRVMYGTSWPFLYATAASKSTGSFGATASVKLTNLNSNTTYYYVRESIDSSGNLMWTTYDTFRTE
jgi:peptidoglycan hydrolase-like protein with peptidoglycan-binding domain